MSEFNSTEETLAAMVADAASLRKSLAELDAKRKRDRTLMQGLVALLATILLATVLILGDITNSAKAEAKKNQAIVSRIEDCTSPDGKCYLDNLRKTSKSAITGPVYYWLFKCYDLNKNNEAAFSKCLSTHLGLITGATPSPKANGSIPQVGGPQPSKIATPTKKKPTTKPVVKPKPTKSPTKPKVTPKKVKQPLKAKLLKSKGKRTL